MSDTPILLQPELASASGRVMLDDELFHHIRRVLRLRDGDAVELRDGRGLSAEARIVKVSKRGAELELGEKRDLPTPPGPRIGLALPLLKGKRLDWVLEKATELGVAAFHLYIGEHSVVRRDKGHERYSSIVQAAFRQSRRPLLPELLQPVAFADLAREAAADGRRQVWADEELGYGGGAEQDSGVGHRSHGEEDSEDGDRLEQILPACGRAGGRFGGRFGGRGTAASRAAQFPGIR